MAGSGGLLLRALRQINNWDGRWQLRVFAQAVAEAVVQVIDRLPEGSFVGPGIEKALLSKSVAEPVGQVLGHVAIAHQRAFELGQDADEHGEIAAEHRVRCHLV